MNDLFIAIIGGVGVFVVSQYLQRFIFEPLLEFKKLTTEISQVLLLNQGKIYGGDSEDEQLKNYLHSLSAKLRGYTKIVPFYTILYWTRVFGLPHKKSILVACHCLNTLGYGVIDAGFPKITKIQLNTQAIEDLRVLLNIETTYAHPVDKS